MSTRSITGIPTRPWPSSPITSRCATTPIAPGTAYYRQVRLIHEHSGRDPATLTEAQLRDYFLFVKLQKHWKPKSIRQALAAASMFFVQLLGHTDWTLFSQIRTRDHDTLPPVLTRQQVAGCWPTSACAAIALRSSSSTVAGCV